GPGSEKTWMGAGAAASNAGLWGLTPRRMAIWNNKGTGATKSPQRLRNTDNPQCLSRYLRSGWDRRASYEVSFPISGPVRRSPNSKGLNCLVGVAGFETGAPSRPNQALMPCKG